MLKQFLGDVLPPEGRYCLFLLPERQHFWYGSTDELAQGVLDLGERERIYFGTASFSGPSRRAENVHLLRSLRLDIDAGPDKFAKHGDEVYPTQQDALAAVRDFVQATGLMPGYVISSGQGLHVYYVLSQDLPPEQWAPLAAGLAELAKQHGLRADPTVTQDAARILRPVGTMHSPGNVVRVLARSQVRLDPQVLAAQLPAPAMSVPTLGGLAIPDYLKGMGALNDAAAPTVTHAPSSAFKAAQQCAALAEIAASGGCVPEPQWRAMIGFTTCTVEGRDAAHQWSRGYEGYDPAEVDRKYDAWATGPTTCAEFSKYTRACDTCPHKGKVKSPITLGVLNVAEHDALPPEKQLNPAAELPPPPGAPVMPWEGRLSPGYAAEKQGDHWTLVQRQIVHKENEAGERVPLIVTIPVSYVVFWLGYWSEAEDSEDTAQVSVLYWNGRRVKRLVMEQGLIASPAKLAEWLAGKGIHAGTHQKSGKAMQDYFKEQLMSIRHLENPKIADHLGLRINDDGQLLCAQGKYVIYGDGTIREGLMRIDLRSTAALYQVPVDDSNKDCWAPDVWASHIEPKAREYAEFLRKHYGGDGPIQKLQLAIMMGFASPFMPFVTGEFLAGSALPSQSALSVSLHSSKAGRGKTAAAKTVLVAFGRASKVSEDAGRANTTEIARTAQLQLIGTLPNLMDEMGNNDPRSVSDTVNAVANGSPRRRASRDGRGLREGNSWSLVNLITTNTSQRDMIAAIQANSDAIQQRLLEINVDDLPDRSSEQRADFERDWARVASSCAGALGAVIHREMCAMGVHGVNDLVRACVSRASDLIDDQAARFQYRGLGAMIAAHMVMSRLGLGLFDLPALVAQFKVAYDASRVFISDNVASQQPLEQVGRMVQDLRPYIVVTDAFTRGGTSGKHDHVLNHRTPDKVEGRYVRSTGRLYLSAVAVKKWADEHGLVDRELVTALRDTNLVEVHTSGKGGVQRTTSPVTLTAGLRDSVGSPVRAYTLHLHRLNRVLGVEGDANVHDNVVPMPPPRQPQDNPTEEIVNDNGN